MSSLLTRRRLAASSISCGLHATYLSKKKWESGGQEWDKSEWYGEV